MVVKGLQVVLDIVRFIDQITHLTFQITLTQANYEAHLTRCCQLEQSDVAMTT